MREGSGADGSGKPGVAGSTSPFARRSASAQLSSMTEPCIPSRCVILWRTTMDKLAVDQPNYASYKRELAREK